jgi:hypothetical protein
MTKDDDKRAFQAYLKQIVGIEPLEGYPGYARVSLKTGHVIFIGRGMFVVLDPDKDGGPHGIEKLKALLRATRLDGEPEVL